MIVKFSGKSHAKGRNGYFKLHELHSYEIETDEQPLQLDIYSKRSGDAPPIRFKLTREDAATLRDFMNSATPSSTHRQIIAAALIQEFPWLETDQPVSGADVVDWIGEFYARMKAPAGKTLVDTRTNGYLLLPTDGH
jgi:hypothetical protein